VVCVCVWCAVVCVCVCVYVARIMLNSEFFVNSVAKPPPPRSSGRFCGVDWELVIDVLGQRIGSIWD
jgi:hypothetical protein